MTQQSINKENITHFINHDIVNLTMTLKTETYPLKDDYIELYALLKLLALGSGGEAKQVISEGLVTVDGEVETRKKCKIRAGQCVQFETLKINVIQE